MPTLFRLLTAVFVIAVGAYAIMFAMATFVRPEQREIVQTVALPQAVTQDGQLSTGRSVASQLDRQASLLMRRHHRHTSVEADR